MGGEITMLLSNTLSKMYDRLVEANHYRLNNQLEKAIAVYQSCIDQFGINVELLATIAQLSFSLALTNPGGTEEDFQKAIGYLKRALRLEPNRASLHAQLAEIYALGTLNYELAAAEYRHALKLNPHNISILFDAASLYGVPEGVVMLDEVISWMEHAIELNPDNIHYYNRIASLYQEAGRMIDAKSAWSKALLCSQPLELEFVKRILD